MVARLPHDVFNRTLDVCLARRCNNLKFSWGPEYQLGFCCLLDDARAEHRCRSDERKSFRETPRVQGTFEIWIVPYQYWPPAPGDSS